MTSRGDVAHGALAAATRYRAARAVDRPPQSSRSIARFVVPARGRAVRRRTPRRRRRAEALLARVRRWPSLIETAARSLERALDRRAHRGERTHARHRGPARDAREPESGAEQQEQLHVAAPLTRSKP